MSLNLVHRDVTPSNVVLTSAGANEIDVHSNDIDGGGTAVACTSGAVDLDVVGTPPTAWASNLRTSP